MNLTYWFCVDFLFAPAVIVFVGAAIPIESIRTLGVTCCFFAAKCRLRHQRYWLSFGPNVTESVAAMPIAYYKHNLASAARSFGRSTETLRTQHNKTKQKTAYAEECEQ